MSKGVKLKVKMFRGLIPMFVEVTGKNMAGRPFWNPPPPHPE